MWILENPKKPEHAVRTVQDIWDEFTDYEKGLTYELVGQAVENGSYTRDCMVVFSGEKRAVVDFLITKVMEGGYK